MVALDTKLWSFLKASALPWVAVGVLVMMGIAILVWVRNRYRDREDREAAMQQMLIQFRELKREGDLSDEEYRSIKNRVVEQIGKPSRDKSNDELILVESKIAEGTVEAAESPGVDTQDGPGNGSASSG